MLQYMDCVDKRSNFLVMHLKQQS